MERTLKKADVAIVGGGAAGCLPAISAKEANPEAKVMILEKACIRRGGSLAWGMDAINVVVIPGISQVEDLVRAQMSAAQGILDPAVVRAAGLSALDIRGGEFLAIPARTVILAAGSGARFGLPETGVLHAVLDCPACAGDSYSLGYRAGAQLVNMECLKHKITVRHFNGPGLAPLSLGGRLVNAFRPTFSGEVFRGKL